MNSRDIQDVPPAQPLTPREDEILALIGQGKTNRQIAEELSVARSTVKWYVRQIYNKLNVNNREEAIGRARELGLLTAQELFAEGLRGYEIRERLGAGRYGLVYRAYQTAVQRDVAIKTILPRLANQPDFIRRFEFEARLVARLEHPNIVPLYDYWRDPTGAYLVMRWLRGGSLRDEIAQGPLSLETTASLVEQITSALNFAHEQKVIHQDIRPANILLDEAGHAYVADFGIGLLVEQAGMPEPVENGYAYALSSPIEYSSPEQLRGTPPTILSDIYNLGVVIYEMIAGRHPFSDLPLKEIRRRQLVVPLPLIHEQCPDVPAAVDEVIQKATSKEPAQRFQSALELAAAYAQAISGEIEVLPGISIKREASVVNPYKGLRPFIESDAGDFFGRERLVESLLARLAGGENERVLAVVGPSGSGKSSVVRAGLIPALRSGALPGSEKWFFVQMHPGRRPFEELEAALLRVAVNPPGSLFGRPGDDEEGGGFQPGDVQRALLRCLPDDGQLFLLIDQFEELFTLVEEEEIRRRFLDSLAAAASDPDGRLHLALTLRADFYDRPLLYPGFGQLIRDHTETVLPLTAEELERAIVQPARNASVQFEEGLAARIIDDVLYQPGALPLLQYALTELYDKQEGQAFRHETYAAIGGISGALARRAEALYLPLDPEEQEALRQVFLRLVALDEDHGAGPGTRRRVSREILADLSPDNVRLGEIIDAFAAARLLTLDYDPLTRAPTVEIAHEALIEEWARLRAWLAESQDDLYQQQRLNLLTNEWLAQDRDPGLLLRETRLDQLAAWAQNSSLILTSDEEAYLARSLEARSQRRAEEEARREQELDNARQLAEAERRRAEEQSAAAGRLRRRAFLLVGALAIAAVLAAAAVVNGSRATQSAREAQNLALVSGSQAALANDDTDAALALAWQAVSLNPDSALAQAQLSEAAYAPGTVRILAGNEATVSWLAMSPDNTKVVGGADDGTVILWDMATGQTVWEANPMQGQQTDLPFVENVAFSPDGQIVAATFNDRIMLWNAADGRLIHQIESAVSRQKIAFDPAGEQFATIGSEEDGRLVIWDLASGEAVRKIDRGSNIEDIVYSADGSTILIASISGVLTLLDAQTGEVIYEVQEDLGTSAGAMRFVALSPDGDRLIAAFANAGLLVWDFATGDLLHHFPYEGGVFAVAYHPQNGSVLTGGLGNVRTINPQTGEIVRTNSAHSSSIVDLVITADGKRAVTTAVDGIVRLWDLQEGQVVRRFVEPNALLFEVALSPDARTVLVGSTDGTATLFDAQTGEEIRQLVDDQPITAVAFSPDGRKALTGGGYRMAQKIESGHIILWDLETGEEIRRFEGHPYVVFDVEFSPDGRLVVSSGSGAVVILWDAETGEEIRRFEDFWVDSMWPVESYWDVQFTPDGRQIFAPHSSGPIIGWDVESGEEVQRLVGHTGGVAGIVFSKDGQLLVSGGSDSQVILWDMQTGNELHRFNDHTGGVGEVQFSPDETLLLGGGGDGTNSLWQIETGEVIRRYGGGQVFSPNFTPDGRHAVVGYRDGAVELWRIDATLDELLTWTKNNRYIPDLTCEQRELYSVEPLCEAAE